MTGALTGAAPARLGLALLASAVAHLLVVWAVGPAWHRTPPPTATGPLTARLASAEPAAPAVEVAEAASAVTAAREVPAPPRVRTPETVPAPATSRPPVEQPAADSSPEPARSLAIAVPADPTWYAVRQLHVLPRALKPVEPAFPARAEGEGVLAGEVTLIVLIDEEGDVTEVHVESAKPAGYFEEAAMESFRGARFSPGERNGRKVKSRVLVRVNFASGEKTAPR